MLPRRQMTHSSRRSAPTSIAIVRIRWRSAPGIRSAGVADRARDRADCGGARRRRLVEAIETIEWFSSIVSSKLYRAICGEADGGEGRQDAQTDFNGSAKIALISIAESRRAWAVLMEAGRATADGVPAQAVKALDELDAAVRARFPRVMEFVRPGFDEPRLRNNSTEGERTGPAR